MAKQRQSWWLRKADGAEYGPVSLADLLRWTAQCRVVAGNSVSVDREEWMPVESLPELEMHWFAHRADGKEYGPFPLNATRELFEHEVLPADALLINRATGEQRPLQALLDEPEASGRQAAPAPTDAAEAQDNRQAAPTDTDEAQDKREADHAEDKAGADHEQALQAVREKAVALEDCQQQLEQKESARVKAEHARRTEAETYQANTKVLQNELEAARQAASRQFADCRRKLDRLHSTLQEQTTQKEEAEGQLAALRTRHREAEAALQRADECRRQSAFMKKNIAVLQAELESARRQATSRARLLMAIGGMMTVITALVLMRMTSSCRTRLAGSPPGTTATVRETGEYPREAASSTGQPVVTDPPRHALARAPWPTINIKGISASKDRDQLVLKFEQGSFSSLDTLSTTAERQLGQLAEQLQPYVDSLRIVVEGHTDNIPLRTSSEFADNTTLAKARAETVKAFMTAGNRLPPGAIVMAPPGMAPAPYPNDTPENRKRNRTVVIRISRR